MKRIYYSIKQFFRNIKNIIRWIPVLWSDRDWDHGFIYILLHKKLEHMEEFFRSDKSYTSDATEVAEEIKAAKELAYRLFKNNYLNEALIDFENKYGENAIFTVANFEDGKLTWTVDDEKMEMFRKACRDSDINYETDKEKLFDLMKEKVNGWWD